MNTGLLAVALEVAVMGMKTYDSHNKTSYAKKCVDLKTEIAKENNKPVYRPGNTGAPGTCLDQSKIDKLERKLTILLESYAGKNAS